MFFDINEFNDVQPAASQGYQNAQQDLGNYYFHIYTHNQYPDQT